MRFTALVDRPGVDNCILFFKLRFFESELYAHTTDYLLQVSMTCTTALGKLESLTAITGTMGITCSAFLSRTLSLSQWFLLHLLVHMIVPRLSD